MRGLRAPAVAGPATRDPLAPGLPVDAARAELGLPDRGLVEALAAWPASGGADQLIDASGGYLRRGSSSEDEQRNDAGRSRAGQHRAAGGTAAQGSQAGLPAPVADAGQAVRTRPA